MITEYNFEITDCFIKEKALENKEIALDLLMEKYEQKIFYYIYYITNNYEDTVDITHEVFIKAYYEKDYFSEKFNMKAWLYRVAYNKSVDFLRKLTIKFKHFVFFNEEKEYRSDFSVYENYLQNVQNEKLYRSIKKLEKDYKNIIILRFFENFSYQEIAEILNIKIGTVMSRISNAKKKLKLVYENDEL